MFILLKLKFVTDADCADALEARAQLRTGEPMLPTHLHPDYRDMRRCEEGGGTVALVASRNIGVDGTLFLDVEDGEFSVELCDSDG